MRVWTIGHSTRTIDKFISLLLRYLQFSGRAQHPDPMEHVAIVEARDMISVEHQSRNE